MFFTSQISSKLVFYTQKCQIFNSNTTVYDEIIRFCQINAKLSAKFKE